MCGQVCVDVGYVQPELFDENILAPAGSGCRKGLDYIYNASVPASTQPRTVQNLLRNLREKQGMIWEMLGYQKDGKTTDPLFCLSLMTLENLMCESSKYIEILTASKNHDVTDGNPASVSSTKIHNTKLRKRYAPRTKGYFIQKLLKKARSE